MNKEPLLTISGCSPFIPLDSDNKSYILPMEKKLQKVNYKINLEKMKDAKYWKIRQSNRAMESRHDYHTVQIVMRLKIEKKC